MLLFWKGQAEIALRSHRQLHDGRFKPRGPRSRGSDRQTQRRAPCGRSPLDSPRLPPPPPDHLLRNHGCSRGAFPALPRIKWTLRRVWWEYTGAVDLWCLDGNHVAAAGGHGTEPVRLADGGHQVASRKQKGTGRARFSPGTGSFLTRCWLRIKLFKLQTIGILLQLSGKWVYLCGLLFLICWFLGSLPLWFV